MEMMIDDYYVPANCISADLGKRSVKQENITAGAVKEMVGAVIPAFGTKTATVVLIVKGEDADDIRKTCDWIVKHAGGAGHIFSFSALSHSFRGVLSKYSMQDRVPDRMTRLTLTLEGQEVGDLIDLDFPSEDYSIGKVEYYTRINEVTINNPGTYWTPAYAELSFGGGSGASPKFSVSGLLRDPWYMSKKDLTVSILPDRDFYLFLDAENGIVYPAADYGKCRNYMSSYRNMTEAEAEQTAENDLLNLFTEPEPLNISADTMIVPGLPFLAPGENRFSVSTTSAYCVLCHMSFRPVYL